MSRAAYRVAELAAALGVAESTVRGWIRRGRLRARTVEGVTLIPAAEYDRLLGVLEAEPEPPRPLAVRTEAAALLQRVRG